MPVLIAGTVLPFVMSPFYGARRDAYNASACKASIRWGILDS